MSYPQFSQIYQILYNDLNQDDSIKVFQAFTDNFNGFFLMDFIIELLIIIRETFEDKMRILFKYLAFFENKSRTSTYITN